jgi:hypothetical protein
MAAPGWLTGADMPHSYVVVDGSNIATEGRSVPSLAQLDDAVRQFQAEFPGTEIIVVVDATFGHRIDPSERKAFDEAVAHAELVSPPAGAVGRGDAFLLRVAERVGAQVLSNDSFQEFHAEHPWLFDEGRLIGGKPVPGVGWIFTPRSPVRGARSREALAEGSAKAARAAKTAKSTTGRGARAGPIIAAAVAAAGAEMVTDGEKPARSTRKAASGAAKTEKAAKAAKVDKSAKSEKVAKSTKAEKSAKATKAEKSAKATKAEKSAKAEKAGKRPRAPAAKATTTNATEAAGVSASTRGRRGRGRRATAPDVRAAIDVATVEAIAAPDSDEATAGTGRRRRAEPPPAVNDPLTFLTFVSEHPVGSTVEGTVSSFVSHGAMVEVGDMQCYVPLAGLGTPPPRRAREVLERGDHRAFVLVALDPSRRGAELALPELAAARLAR